MYIINSKTGKAEEITDADIEAADRKQRKSTSSGEFGAGQRNSTFGNKKRAAAAPDTNGAPVITRSSEQKKRSGKSVFGRKTEAAIPGEFTRSSDRKPLYKEKPPAGTPRTKPEQSSRSYAVWLLSRQDYSALNLRKKLLARGYSEEEAEEAMVFVIANKYQDDTRFAEHRARGVENRAGNVRIEMTLRQKGIPADIAKAQVQQLGAEEERVLLAVAKYKSRVAEGGMTTQLKAKIYRFLAYRGFSSKAIRIGIQSLEDA
ncbi:MAG: regulatory protein RecX [Pseudomonadota bacterium]